MNGDKIMSNFAIFTDSACDLSEKVLNELDVKSIDLTFVFEGEEKQYTNRDMSVADFYDRMRKGGVAKTSAINADTFKTVFEEELKKGNDVLYIGLSSGLSATYASARMAAEELGESYPDRKIMAVDSLCASAGQGLLVALASDMRKSGADVSKTARYVFDIRMSVSHWFTVDDLVYLKRGGRVSTATALLGGMLNIKPVLHVDNEGHLVSVSKARGRKAALKEIVEKYGELAKTPNEGRIFISQADCMEDAKEVARMIKEKFGVETELIENIGPVIGAHAGPGTLALFYIAKER